MPEQRLYNPAWLTRTPIAHRGLHGGGIPENSLAAFAAAALAGYAIELDVRLTSDHKLVVIHDPTAGRMTGQDLLIASTPAARLTTLRLGGTTQAIPLLTDALNTVAGRVPVLIEVKTGSTPREAGPILRGIIDGYAGEIAVESFDPHIIAWFRRHAPHIPRGQLASSLPKNPQPKVFKRILRAMPLNLWTRPQFIAFDVRDYPTPALKLWQRLLHIPVLLWTVKTQDQLEAAKSHHLNYIFEKIRP